MNSQSEDFISETDNISADVVENLKSQSDDDNNYTFRLNVEEDSDSEIPDLLLSDAFNTADKGSNVAAETEDMLNLLSGQFTFSGNDEDQESETVDAKSQTKQICQSGLIDLLSGEFQVSQAQITDSTQSGQDIQNDNFNADIERLSSSEREDDANDSDSSTMASSDEGESASLPHIVQPLRQINDVLMKKESSIVEPKKNSAPSFKTAFVEEEADVEEDEFMNFGGADGEIDARLDRYDPEFVEEADKEVVEDFDDVIELHR